MVAGEGVATEVVLEVEAEEDLKEMIEVVLEVEEGVVTVAILEEGALSMEDLIRN